MESQPPEFTPPPPFGDQALVDAPATTFIPDPALAGRPANAVEPFAPPSDAWRRVSPKLTAVKRISASIWLFLLFVPASVIAWIAIPADEPARWVAAGWLAVGILWWAWLWFRARRLVASYGWARRDKDLCIVGGLMFRNLEIVPFGRMQVVKVSSGPLLRAFGLSTVELVTASAATSGTIPGLPADEAKALRDLIIELSDAEGSGL